MADNIRGLKVEISADATKFKKEVKDLRSDVKSAKSDLATLQKSLQLDYNEEKFAEAQKVAQNAIDKTSELADKLRGRLKDLEQSGNVDTDEYQKVQSELYKVELQGAQLQKQLEQINQIKFDNLSKQVTDVGDKITSAGKALAPFSAMATGAVTALGAVGKKAVATGDDIATLATKYDMSSDSLQRFNYVALQTDVQAEDLYKAFTKVRAGVADMATGTESTASKALQQLNLDFASFDGSEEQFYAIADALSNMGDKTQMVAIANDIFGDKLATNLLPLIYAGTDAVNEYRNEFDELGAMTEEQVASMAEFDNVLNKINTQVKNSITQIGASLLPIMEKVADWVSNTIIPKLQSLAEWFNNLTLGQQEFALKIALVVAALAPLTMGIGKLVTTIGSVIEVLPKLQSALSSLASHPIILIVAAVAVILALLYSRCESFREAINNLVGTLGQALQPAMTAILQVFNTLMPILNEIINIVGGVLAVAINILSTALQPVIVGIQMLFGILQSLLSVALIPLQLVLQALQIPLQMLGTLLNWLAPLFGAFANLVQGVFNVVLKVINSVLTAVESAINWCIDKINLLIDTVNDKMGWLGVHLERVQSVSLQIDTSSLDNINDINGTLDTTSPDIISGDNVYDKIGAGGINGDVYNNDYSTNNTTQNITVTIQNYAEEVDVDDLVRQINVKLAEAM
ncbi:MAG: hypothetical protein HDT32_05040 [Clostridiales bacterium]|nr:hypothetical protein [Clostridiales bacterium]